MALSSFPCAPRRVFARTFLKFFGIFRSFSYSDMLAPGNLICLPVFLFFFSYFSAFFAILVAAEKIRAWREVAINVPEILEIPEFLK